MEPHDFTIEELYDAGLVNRRVPFTITPNEIVAEYSKLCWVSNSSQRDRYRDALVRLALARPELAYKALGPEWNCAWDGQLSWIPVRFWWSMATDHWHCAVFVVDGIVDRAEAEARTSRTKVAIPTEFDAALPHARKIAAAYLRVQSTNGAR